ncbi:MAG: PilZ domain-containing protein [Planctomycetota bacterium]
MSDEKRAHERVVARFPVEIKTSDGRMIKGRAENLGQLGVLLTTPDLEAPIAMGDSVGLTLWLPEREPFEARGQVLRVDQEFAEGDLRRTFAIKFDEPVEF